MKQVTEAGDRSQNSASLWLKMSFPPRDPTLSLVMIGANHVWFFYTSQNPKKASFQRKSRDKTETFNSFL